MMLKPKPYRLLSAGELTPLTEQFEKTVRQWQENAACKALTMQLESAFANQEIKKPLPEDCLVVLQENTPVALLPKQAIRSFQQQLFDDDSPCFLSSSQKLFQAFLCDLLQIETLLITAADLPWSDWIYAGSPALLFSLSSKEEAIHLYLHPHWVLAQLPRAKPLSKSLQKLDEAIAPQELNLEVRFKPFSLPLNKLLQLQIGDVIKTDHQLEEPLNLQHQQDVLSLVQIGQQHSFKSIKLTRSS